MNNDELLKQAEYFDIILSLLRSPYEISSISKLVFISFCVYHEDNFRSYANRSKNIVDLFFENISLKLTTHQEELMYIITCIDILKKNSKVTINGDNIELNSGFHTQTENKFLLYCNNKIPNPIIEINKLDTKAIIEEVIRYV